ncbi:Prostaglandin reductase 1 [Portunus trituberculatus]|uniref:15-oxoprostaglandin 13-reductase n=1 Tax=Portunus trituberculatus TaxID=210409 RepID=A0A5B7EB45_PORTR|nr:Prostaglandin reductase 1 [Portunus trituberculatus]
MTSVIAAFPPPISSHRARVPSLRSPLTDKRKGCGNMVVAKVWNLVRRPEGTPRVDDFALVEEQLPPCKEGDVLVEAVALSVDPYMRYRSRIIPLNAPMFGSQVAKVIESKNPEWPVGTHLVHYEGWRTHSLLTAQYIKENQFTIKPMPEMGNLPKSLGIGILGMPGNTAYFGLLDICNPKAGETVLVNGAAGAVGSAVVQIAKIKGCTVIAFAGSDEKVAWVKELGADYVFNYKTTNISDALSKMAPNGINVYFDNVGGKFTAEALPHMADFGRVSVCGAISTYNEKKDEAVAINASLVFPIGKLKYKETEFHGFENMPKAFIGLFHGENTGKAVVLP